jgi:hypothetical protein
MTCLLLHTRPHFPYAAQHEAEVDRLKLELTRCHKTNGEQSERLDKQKKHAEILDARLQELKKAASADQSEIKDLRFKLRMSEHERAQLSGKQDEAGETKKALQALDGKRRDEIRDRDKKISDLERCLASEIKKREAAEARVKDVERKKDEETQEASASVRQLEAQVINARDEARHAQASLLALGSAAASKEQELVAQLENYRTTLGRVAEEYSRLASATVLTSAHDRIKHEHAAMKMQLFRLDRKLANAEGQVVELASLVRYTKEENAFLVAQLREVEEEAMFYSKALSDVTDSQHDRHHWDSGRAAQGILSAIATEMHESRQQIMQTQALDSEATCQFYRLVNGELLQSFLISDKLLETQEKVLEQRVLDLDVALASQITLTTQLEAVRTEREDARGQLGGLIASIEELKVASARLERQLEEAETKRLAEMSKHEEVLAKEHHTIQSLTSTVQKSRMAEESLRADIDRCVAR